MCTRVHLTRVHLIRIKQATENTMKDHADEVTSEQLIADFRVVVADAEALLMATANQGGEKLNEIRAKAEESLRVVKARMAEVQDVLVIKTKAAAQATDAYVHENPWRAIGTAAGLGVLIGWLMGRR